MSILNFAMIGISHEEAGEDIRKHVAFMDTQKMEFYELLLNKGILQAVILSTCNRSEVYMIYDEEKQLDEAISIYEKMANISLQGYVKIKQGKAALLYLYEVCAGYHSLVLGEDQIEGQLQEAYAFATHMQACKKQMHRIFQNCFKTVKQIKTTYQISASPLSIPYIAMQAIKQEMTCNQKCVCLIGSGTMAKLMLTYIKHEPVEKIYLCNRHMDKALALKDDPRIQVIPFEERYQYAKESDLLISATSSPHQIIKKCDYPCVHRTKVCVDLAMPPDMDTSIKELGIKLIVIDDLSNIQDASIAKRKALLKEGHDLIEQGVEDTITWLNSQKLQEALSSLQRKSEESAEAAYQMIISKIDLDHHEQRVVKKILKASFFRMVKEPMMMLSHASKEKEAYIELVSQLFEGGGEK